jgi:hypothetical protein
MSTRCQVKVVQEDVGWNEQVTLYHHMDGYPENMIPLIGGAALSVPENQKWLAGRAGHVASFVCYSDPSGFEPEEGHELHDDIRYYYVLHLKNIAEGSLAENPVWEVEVFETSYGGEERLKLIIPSTPLGMLMKSMGFKPYRRDPEGKKIPLKQ